MHCQIGSKSGSVEGRETMLHHRLLHKIAISLRNLHVDSMKQSVHCQLACYSKHIFGGGACFLPDMPDAYAHAGQTTDLLFWIIVVTIKLADQEVALFKAYPTRRLRYLIWLAEYTQLIS